MQVTITGASAFVARMFEAAGPHQWARELAKNSEEAGATRAEFGIEWQAVRALDVYRRSVADDGRGMGPQQLLKFFSTLGLSGKKIEGVHDNYGVGAKIALLPWNPNGVVVCSWQNGRGSMIWIVLNKVTGNYELVDFMVNDRKSVVTNPSLVDGIDWSRVRPDWLTDHGTVVTLLGDDAHPDTAYGHPRAGGTDLRGLTTYLNTRFWEMPMDVRVHELRSNKRESWPKSLADTGDASRVNRRRVLGARHYVEESTDRGHAVKGEVLVDEGRVKVSWYLWEGPRSAVHSYAREGGYVAVKYRGELYQVSSHVSQFRWFGVSEAEVRQRLTLVVEPQALADGWGIYPDSSRARLMFASERSRGEELPLATWGWEFADNLPQAIRDAVRKAHGATESGEIDPAYRERLAERFGARWTRQAVVEAGPDDPVEGMAGREAGAGRRGEPAGALTRDGEDTAVTKHPKPHAPEISGKGDAHGKQQGSPVDIPRYRFGHKEDFEQPFHIAAWSPHDGEGPTVVVNVDAPVVQEMVKYRQGLYPEAHADEVREVVLRAVGEIAACKVAHVEQLTRVLPAEVVDQDYRSERALTAGMMGLIAEEALIATRLRGKLRARDAA